MSLSVSYLEEIKESRTLDVITRRTITILLNAVNDWPASLVNLGQYENEIYKLIGEEITNDKLESYLLQIDYSKNAWQAESLHQLLEIYDHYDKEKPLTQILQEIENKLKRST